MGLSIYLLSTAVAGSLVLSSCSAFGDSGAPTPRPTESAIATVPAPSPHPTYAVASVPESVTSVIRAIEGQDTVALSRLFAGHALACSNQPPSGIGGQAPPCPEGIPEGTLVGSFIGEGDCEGAWATTDPPPVMDILAISQEGGELLSVVYASPDVMTNEFTYHLVYRINSGRGRIVEVDDKGIVGVYQGCLRTAEAIVDSLVTGGGAVVDPAALR